MNKIQVRQYTGRAVSYKGVPVTLLSSRMVEKTGGTNVTMCYVADATGKVFEVSSRKLAVAS